MDIHRSRFVPYPPSAINALAFSHSDPTDKGKDPECLRLALGRANGSIEIWNPANGTWSQERVFYGGKDRSVEGLVWTQEPDERDDNGRPVPGRLRLFSIGYSSSVTEWDLATGLPARHSNGNHSEVWCFAAQPKMKSQQKGSAVQEEKVCQKLLAGCADGTLVLLSTTDNDLRFDKFVARSTAKKARALSIAFKDRNVAIAGFADSMIRVYDTRNGSVIRNISLGSAGPGGPKEILVWKVKTLPNGHFVSGDSTGDIRIYEGKNYSQTHRISGHEADVLDLAVSRDGTMIFSGGMDRRTCFYTSNKKIAPGIGNQGAKWRKVSHQRYHDHDVKALAAYDGSEISALVSGGIDTQPIVVPIRSFGKDYHRSLAALPHVPPLVSAPEARLLVSWWNCEVRIWRVKAQEDGSEKPKVVARLALQGDENIASVTITRNGSLVAISTAREVKLFQLVEKHLGTGSSFRIRKLEMPSTTGAKLVRFTSDGRWLATITTTDEVHLARLVQPEDPSDRPRVLQKFAHLQRLEREQLPRDSLNSPLGHYSRSITHAEFSADGAVFAIADLGGYIDTWVVEGHEDLTAPEVDIDESATSAEDDDESDDESDSTQRAAFLGQQWIQSPSAHLLPRLDFAPVLLSFEPALDGTSRPEPNGNPAVHPTRHNPHPRSHDISDVEHRLLVLSADQRIYLFDVLSGRLSEWSRRNPPSSYPPQYRTLKSPAKGCVWDDSGKERIWLYGEDWMFMFDLSQDLPILESTDTSNAADAFGSAESRNLKKRKREVAKSRSRKGVSGAGDAIPEKDVPITRMRKFDSGKANDAESTLIELYNDRIVPSDEEVDDDHLALADVRSPTGQDGMTQPSNGMVNGEALARGKDGVEGSGGNFPLEQRKRSSEHWWHTFKYRPILGMVPLGGVGQPLEVAMVERPKWDVDLPPRFVGAHE